VLADFLKIIAAHKRNIIVGKMDYYKNLKKNMKTQGMRRYEVFKKAITRPGQINLIAEIKKASPSVGLIRDDFDVMKIAKIYKDNNAAAISVLTEEKYFHGRFLYLNQVSEHSPVPVLMKDFIIDECQIYEGSVNGASAILLIVAMLEENQLKDLMACAHALGLDCLIEVHDEAEIERALDVDAEIIGVNNRNLKTLHVDVANALRMIPRIPKGKIIVAESGLRTHDDVLKVQQAGAHAVLIGETFMRANDIGAKIKEVMHGQG
jgi:indole-3-glycerol phosphate synthase